MDKMLDYLINEKGLSETVAHIHMNKVTKYKDIRMEFDYWLNNRDYNIENPIVIEGYSARQIFKMAEFLDGVGVFNFMVTLRDNPEEAKAYIRDGFRIR